MAVSTSARTTASMLGEISTATAAELVMAIRYASAPPGPTHISQLDDILREARGTDSTPLRRGDMVELIGPSGSGKTSLCLFLLLTRLLPSSIVIDLPAPNSHSVSVPLGGRNDQATIIIPSSHRSPVLSLANHIRSHITGHVADALSANLRPRTITPALSTSIEESVKDTLSRLRIIRIKPRWRDLALALEKILRPPRLVLDPTREDEERLDLLVIDGFGDGFWPERWNTEDRPPHSKNQGRIRNGEDVGMRDIVRQLEAIRRELGSVVLVTLQALWPSDGLFATHMPPPYPAPYGRDRDEPPRAWPLNVQITLTGRKVSQPYPADMILVDALQALQIEQRHHEDSQVFEGVVRVPGTHGLAGSMAGVKFEMRIGGTGVEIYD